ncbi:FKBP-type peptidyl-prolyl cis-trans isomerase [Cellulomonas fulva]|uniref:FKBP-type peptidyl-prolyl cis-trans isomerase n=1 Tax=Cellulomonas fulva TaxID=2835530 RepID=UPI0027DC4440|nr:FKBP-type peptidyl-prolyl cis-trans isomerase [Cellulomonas fulva]
MTALTAAVVAAALGLAACSEPEVVLPDVTVSGDAGAAPTLTYVTPLVVDDAYRETVWPGTGPRLVDGEPVLIDYWLENGDDASLVKESYSSTPTSQLLTAEDLGADLYTSLRGQSVGARLLQVAPPQGGTTSYTTVTVIDVLPTRAEGEPIDPREGLPTVGEDEDGAPTFTPVDADAPTDLVVQAVLRGTGRQVGAGDTVTVQYTGWTWTDGEQFDTTWSSGLPVSFSLQDVPAWSEGLEDQTVGSRVLLVVPPSYALGVTESTELEGQTVAFVVDVLDARAPEGASE